MDDEHDDRVYLKIFSELIGYEARAKSSFALQQSTGIVIKSHVELRGRIGSFCFDLVEKSLAWARRTLRQELAAWARSSSRIALGLRGRCVNDDGYCGSA
ncbi:MAG: hypothetical protein KDK08_22605 [Rhizobiaceae bacterium]|nr:hypothetical protein [Rhizobiaceae bacterium]